ncbi:outer membrane protein assembly factor BamD [Alphaproteobacteria bacterium]|nr:outer membrane protein assembly factor BamD [Alphaproteobacteria bacterium]GHS95683.1 outer membrane protein assembly factor BamD [Alphaproteobacteria bacterium]
MKTENLKKLRLLLILVGGAGLLSACHHKEKDLEEVADVPAEDTKPVEELYEAAAKLMKAKSFKSAASGFAKVQEQHPYSRWGTQAQIMEAYCRYQAHQYEDAIDLFTIFAKLYPHHKDTPYALYMIGLSHYERIPIVERDQEDSAKSLDAFQNVLSLYPTCDYAKDAKLKIDFILSHMAAQEMTVGRFYQKNNAYLAAINRFRTVVVKYQKTDQRLEALARLAECYASLKMKDDFEDMYQVLKINHKDSYWFQKTEALRKRSLETKGFWEAPVFEAKGGKAPSLAKTLEESETLTKAPPPKIETSAKKGRKDRIA